MAAETLLALWNDTPTRRAIVDFVQAVGTEGSPGSPRPSWSRSSPAPEARDMRAEPTYEIRIADQLDEATLTSFAGLDVTVRAGVTVITGQFDQAALHGMLERIRSLGLDLEEVRRVGGSEPGRRSR